MIKYIFISLYFLFTTFTISYSQDYTSISVDSLIILLQQTKIDTQKINILNEIGNKYWKSSNYIKAIKYVEEALTKAKLIEYYPGIGTAYSILGNIEFTKANYTSALDKYYLSLRARTKTGDIRSIAKTHNNIALVFVNQNKYNDAIIEHKKSYQLNNEANNKSGIATSLLNIGILFLEQSKNDSAKTYMQQSLQLWENIDDSKGYSSCLNSLSTVYFNTGEVAKGMEFINKSIEIKRKINDQYGICKSYHNLGLLFFKLKNFKEAELYIKKALVISLEHGFSSHLKEHYYILSRIDSTLGNFKQALENYSQYINYKDSIFNKENSNKIVQTKLQYEYELKEATVKQETDSEIHKQKLFRNIFIGSFLLMGLFSIILYRQGQKLKTEKHRANLENQRSEELLLNILPQEIAHELRQYGSAKAKSFDTVSVMFADFKDFTKVSETVGAELLVQEINLCFSQFDHIVQKHNIEKIKTIGDAYLCVGGLPISNTSHAIDIINCSLEMNKFIQDRKREKEAKGEFSFEIKIGIHSGPVVAGIVGIKKYGYDIWGETVNIAAQMEQNSEAGKINISGTTYEFVKDIFTCEYRGKLHSKNKGDLDMYFVY